MKNYGLIIPKIETRLQGAGHVLGAFGDIDWPIVNPSGSWLGDLPDFNPQRKGVTETSACTLYGSHAAFSTYEHRATGAKVNWSERYSANQAKRKGVLDPDIGADPHQVLEMLRNESGLVPEADAPWGDDIKSVNDYYALDVIPLIPKAVSIYKLRRISHKWLWSDQGISPVDKRARIQDALTKGTVCVSVRAWIQGNNNLYIKPDGSIDGHWTFLPEAEGSKPYKVFDSYLDTYDGDAIKLLDPYYDFNIAKVIRIDEVYALFLTNLAFRMTHAEVARLQKALIKLGHGIPNAVTNYYGTETRNAVWKFQLGKGIDDDGTHFGPRTRYALNTELNPSNALGNLLILLRSYTGL